MKSFLTLLLLVIFYTTGFSQTELHIPIKPQETTTKTDSKPQSKVWTYKDSFYTVFPDHSGTYVWKLKDQEWIRHLYLAPSIKSKADCFAKSDTVFILLFQGQKSIVTLLKFDDDSQQYQLIDGTSGNSSISLDDSTETATLAIDSNEILWMAYEANNNIQVRNSMAPYKTWSDPETIYVGVADDDICAIVKMSHSIGVLWSNQVSKRFGFKVHVDGAAVSDWSKDEMPASHSAVKIGDGMADDHINIKFTSAGELFAAVKTSYDTPGYTKIGLLVRRSNGSWDDLHHVSYTGTRPITSVDEASNTLKVYYTSQEAGGDIVFKQSKLETINFEMEQTALKGGLYNNVSSTKFSHKCNNVIIASDENQVYGCLIKCP